ncbi:hypothetical protein [Methanococcoides sp. FTZ1]|uniref:hypothetical protein n=1 Tax=Methanococcoides sp. FTZ1 TaxID=3439061 RepID=UPI003F86A8DE
MHGLGHLTNPFPKAVDDWQAEIWEDILKFHNGMISGIDIEEKYSGLYAISRLTVSTPNVLHRFDKINKGNPWSRQIKPFDFYHVGFQAVEEDGKAVKPLAPYSDEHQKIVYEPFIDYETGDIKEGSNYFKPLSRTIMQYVEHPEHKFDGDTGVLDRKHVHADGVVYIGKEANNIDEQGLEVMQAQEFVNEEEIKQLILNLRPKEAKEYGIKHRSDLIRLKKNATEGKLNFRSQLVRGLIKHTKSTVGKTITD